jgi:thioesterase domain-containing protein
LVILIQTMHPSMKIFGPDDGVAYRLWRRTSKRIDLERENLSHRGNSYIFERIRRARDIVSARTAIALDGWTRNGGTSRKHHSMPYILELLAVEHAKALSNYKPSPYSGNVLLLRAGKQMPGTAVDPDMGWRDAIDGNLDVSEVPGHQQNLLSEPHVATLAREIEVRLRMFQEERDLQSKYDLIDVRS